MISLISFKEIALSLPGTAEEPHFEKTSFRVRKKIFATLDLKKHLLCVKFTEMEQSVFAYDPTVIYPVPNAWGKQGWTYIDLKKVKKTVLKDALKAAYENVSKK
ncbi:MAG: MmcQ/YjbR family DNA-binding protein [Bacteroidota bacterium]|nr:MmcQ/YjbR family DNA-binding protein [Bacteroidota bacterium]